MERLQGDGWASCTRAGRWSSARWRRARRSASTRAASSRSSPPSPTTSSSWRAQERALRRRGLFFATLRGPGRVWLQSLPFSRLASRIYAAAPQAGGRRHEEGSLLGGLGNLLDGDGR